MTGASGGRRRRDAGNRVQRDTGRSARTCGDRHRQAAHPGEIPQDHAQTAHRPHGSSR